MLNEIKLLVGGGRPEVLAVVGKIICLLLALLIREALAALPTPATKLAALLPHLDLCTFEATDVYLVKRILSSLPEHRRQDWLELNAETLANLPLSETVAELEAHLANLMHLPPEPIPEIPETIEVEVDPAPQPEPGLENSTPEPEPVADVIPIKRTLVVPPVLGPAAPHYGNHWNGCT